MTPSGDLPHLGIKPRVSCISCIDWETVSLPEAQIPQWQDTEGDCVNTSSGQGEAIYSGTVW